MDKLQLCVVGDGNLYFTGWLGRITDEQKNVISYLKTLKFLTQICDYAVTNATIIGAIRDLND